MSALVKAELSATCNTLGHQHHDNYIIDDQCYESVRDLIRFLRRDDESHEIRRYLGDAKIVQSDLVKIIQTCEQAELFDITIRLLVNLTNPVILLYKEEIPSEKVGRNIYLSLQYQLQEYKIAFTSIEVWNKISSKLSDLFEIDWVERSEDEGLQIERILVLIRNVLQIPFDAESEKRVDNDVSIHDQVLWGLRQSQILELLLYISSNRYETQYFIHILEIFSLILREQNPELLASCSVNRSEIEKQKDVEDLEKARRSEKKFNRQHLIRHSNFGGTYVLQNVKSVSDKDTIFHKPLHKVKDISIEKKRRKTPKNRVPEESERTERRSTFSVRLFLKELCVEFLSSTYNQLMSIVKEKLVSGKALPNDESYYFWALKFFMEFNRSSNLDIKHVSETINIPTFHYVQTQIENCFDHIMIDKKKMSLWLKRLHIILKAYKEMLLTVLWMDTVHDKKVNSTSEVLKSRLFYVIEYRELIFYMLLKYDPTKFSKKYARDLLHTTHVFLKLFKKFCENRGNKLVAQKKKKIRKQRSKEIGLDQRWEEIKPNVIDALNNTTEFPDICPYETGQTPDEEKIEAMRKVQTFLREGKIVDGIGVLRSARNLWPENNSFGFDGMPLNEEVQGLQDIFMTDLGVDEVEEEEQDEIPEYGEENLHYKDFIKRLANKKIVEACVVLLEDYNKNTQQTNNIILKTLFKIAYECQMPCMLYQARLFLCFMKIIKENRPENKEFVKFITHIMRKFRQHAEKNHLIYMELLFWKDPAVAYQCENGYESWSKGKTAGWSLEEEEELRRLALEYDEKTPDIGKIEWIASNIIKTDRSQRSVTLKLRQMGLIPQKERAKPRPPIEWSEDEITQLTELYHQFFNANDAVTLITDRLTVKRPKFRVVEKLIELDLIQNKAQLKKGKHPKRTQVPEDMEAAEQPQLETHTLDEQRKSVSDVKSLGMTDALAWLIETYEECLDEDLSDEGYPLLALDNSHIEALQSDIFTNMLKVLGFTPPSDRQIYWMIPPHLSKDDIESKIDIIRDTDAPTERSRPNQVTSDSENSQSNHSRDSSPHPNIPETYRSKQIGSDSESSENALQTKSVASYRNCIGSDSDELGFDSSKRSRVNSDSENEGDVVRILAKDMKRRRILMDSDSECGDDEEK